MSPSSVATMRTLSKGDSNHPHHLSKSTEKWSGRSRRYWTQGLVEESWSITWIGLDAQCRNAHGNRRGISTMHRKSWPRTIRTIPIVLLLKTCLSNLVNVILAGARLPKGDLLS